MEKWLPYRILVNDSNSMSRAVPKLFILLISPVLIVICYIVYTNRLTVPLASTGTYKPQKSHSNVPTVVEFEDVKTRRPPDAIIIGAKKCGTRALLNFLNAHPDIKAAGREIHFFDKEEYYGKDLEVYLSMLPEVSSNKVLIEKTPGYFLSKKAPSWMFSMLPKVKLLLIVRDPIDRVISDYLQFKEKFSNTTISYNNIENIVYLPKGGGINDRVNIIRNSMYCIYMESWLKVFPREQIHVVDGDLLIHDPSSALRGIETFLGLKPFLTKDKFVFDSRKGFYCIRKDQSDVCLGSSKGRPHPQVDGNLLKDLKKYFRECNIKFAHQTNMSFAWSASSW